jgi:hypothetical protein
VQVAPAAARTGDPVTRQPFAGNIIPASRVDHTISSRDNIFGSYMFNTQADNTVPTFTFDTRGNRARTQNLSLTEVHVFSPSVVNEARAGWNRMFEHEFFGSTGDPRDYGAPAFTAGYSMPTTQTNGPRGSFGFNGNVTAIGASPTLDNQFAEFLLGLATTAQLSPARRTVQLNSWSQAYYFQDDWKLARSLTLNFGMRYEYMPPFAAAGQSVNFALNGFCNQ